MLACAGPEGINADELSNLKVVNCAFVSGSIARDGIDIESGPAKLSIELNLTGSAELANSIPNNGAINSVFDDDATFFAAY